MRKTDKKESRNLRQRDPIPKASPVRGEVSSFGPTGGKSSPDKTLAVVNRAEESLRRQSHALARLSASPAVASGDFASAALEITRAAAEALDVARATVWMFNDEQTEMRCVARYERVPASHVDGPLLTLEQYPNYFRSVLAGRTIDAHDALSDPRLAEFVDEEFRPLGITAMMDTAISVGGRIVGAICFAHTGPTRHWEPDELIFASAVAHQAGLALAQAERKHAEQALRENQRVLSTLLSNLPGMAYRCRNEPDWTMEFVSDGCRALTGCAPEDLVGNRRISYGRLIHPEDSGRVWDEVQSALGGRRPFELTYRINVAGSVEKWVWERGQGVFSSAGELQAIEGFITDITERRRAEEALIAGERTLRAILDQSFQFIGLIDTAGRILRANKTALDSIGAKLEDVVGKPFWETPWWAHSPAEQQRLREAVERARFGEFVRFETSHPSTDGRLIYVDFSLKPVLDESGKVVALIPEGRDITERRNAEQALRESEEKFAKAFRASPDAIAITDLKTGRFIEASDGHRRMFGYEREEMIGRTSVELGFYQEPADRQKLISAVIAHGSVRDLELKCLTRTGEPLIVLYSGEPIELGGKQCLVAVVRDITGQKKAEQALRESEEKFAKAFLISPDAITLSDAETGRIIEASRGFERVFGWTREETIGRTTLDLNVWGSLDDRRKLLATLERDGRVNNFPAPGRTKTGETRHCLVSVEMGEINGRRTLIVVARDITVQRVAELALRDSEEKFAKAFRASPGAMGISEFEPRRFIEVNDGYTRMFGFSREEMLGRNAWELGLWERAEERQRCMELLEQNGSVRDLEIIGRTRDGRRINCLLSVEMIELGGRPCIVSALNDITGLKTAEERMRTSEARFRNFFQSTLVGMSVTSPDKQMSEVNDHLCQMLGYAREEMLQMHWSDFTVAEDLPSSVEALQRCLSGEFDSYSIERRYRRKDGAIIQAHASFRAVRKADGSIDYFLGVIQDVTAQKEVEAARASLEAQLRQTQKLEALGQLAGGIAHDFNNILAAIIAYTELADMDLDQPSEARKHLAQVRKAGDRAKDLVKQILAFSRQQKQERKPTRLQPLVQEVLKLLRSTLPATIHIEPQIAVDAPVVLADPTQIHQVLMNLCTNAAHAMRDRPGSLTIRLESVVVDETLIRQQVELRSGRYARLIVVDTGHGMDEGTLKRIFEPFFTTKGPGEGTGLGLAVVHGIVRDHEGAIAVESDQGRGTTFLLYFPEHHDPIDEIQLVSGSLPRGQGEQILFVDDEDALCDSAFALLGRLGYRVTTFADPVQALQRFRDDPLEFQLVVTDLTMPGMSGIDLAQQIHQVRPLMPVLLLSGFSGIWTPDKVRTLGIRDLIAKPLSPSVLAGGVRRALDETASIT